MLPWTRKGMSMGADTPRHHGARRRWTQVIWPAVSTLIFIGAAWMVWRQLEEMSLRDFLAALASTAPWAVALSIAFTAASYACLSGTERLALHALGHDLTYRDAARVAVPAYALTNSAGFSPATGTMFRAQLYSRKGLTPAQGATVGVVTGSAVTLSGVVTTGLLMLFDPGAFAVAVRGQAWAAEALGAVLAAAGLLYLYAFTPRAPGWLGGGRGGRLRTSERLWGLAAGVGDWLFSGAALFMLLPNPELAVFATFLAAFVAGCLLSAATGVPGGIGVFEAVVLALTSLFSQVHETAAALLLYRVIYSLGPLSIWGAVILVRTWRRRRPLRHGAAP